MYRWKAKYRDGVRLMLTLGWMLLALILERTLGWPIIALVSFSWLIDQLKSWQLLIIIIILSFCWGNIFGLAITFTWVFLSLIIMLNHIANMFWPASNVSKWLVVMVLVAAGQVMIDQRINWSLGLCLTSAITLAVSLWSHYFDRGVHRFGKNIKLISKLKS